MFISAGAQICLSLAFLSLALWIHHHSVRAAMHSAAILVAALLSVLLYALYFVSDYFTAEGINEAVIYHLTYGLSGAGFSEYAGVSVFAAIALVLAIAILVGVLLNKYFRVHQVRRKKWLGNFAALMCASLSLTINPATADVYRMLSVASRSEDASVSVTEPHNDAALNAEFSQYYVYPQLKRVKNRQPNLVFIYAESLERTYFNEKTFPGLIVGLRSLESEATSFTNIIQAHGTGWTIAGTVASQCGIPLVPSAGNSMTRLSKFLPAAPCLGDLLKSDGYHLTYLGGAAKKFAGKGTFYETHQFDEVAGSNELLPKLQDPQYTNAWGLYDDSLLDIAYEKYVQLAQGQKKFGLFLLTLDTHHPDGHNSRKCQQMRYQDGKNPILNAVHCSDYLLTDFINRLRNSPWGKDTVVVLTSDHLAMRNSAQELLEQQPRRNLFMVLAPHDNEGREVRTQGSTLDIGTTLAPFLGYEFQLGLGRDLMDTEPQFEARSNYIQSRLPAWSGPLSHFWEFPKISERLEVDVDSRIVRIDDQSVPLPCFLEMDSQMQTIIKFPGSTPSMEFVRQNPRDKAFILVTECTVRDPFLPQGKLCLFAGQGNQFNSQLILHSKTRISTSEIRRMTGIRL
jgi:phosphoglycerol transferase